MNHYLSRPSHLAALALPVLLAAAFPAQAAYMFRVPLLIAATVAAIEAPPPSVPVLGTGTFQLTTEKAGATGRAAMFTLDAACVADLGPTGTPNLLLSMGAASVSSGLTYSSSALTLSVAALPAGGDGTLKSLALFDSVSGKTCTANEKVYAAAGWWPIMLTTSRGVGGLPQATSASSSGFSATLPAGCSAADVNATGSNSVYSTTGSGAYASHSGSKLVCLESTPEIAHAFNYTGGTWASTWSPTGNANTTINVSTLSANGVALALDDPWVDRLYFVVAQVTESVYRATGSAATPVNPVNLSYYQGTSYAGIMGAFDGATTADAPAGSALTLDLPMSKALYSAGGTWSFSGSTPGGVVNAVVSVP